MTGSWIVSDKATGRAIVEIFDPERAAQVNAEKFRVEPIGQYLGRVNREIKEKQANRSGFPEGWDRDKTKSGMFVSHRCSRCNDGAKPCPNGQTGPSRNCEYPHARND